MTQADRPLVYLDNAATTLLDRSVADSMAAFWACNAGNASSTHRAGVAAATHVERARRVVAARLGADPQELIFTSGGTESNNLAILGVASAHGDRGRHLVSTTIEHPSVTEPLHHLERQGFEVTWLPVNRLGQVDVDSLRRALRRDTLLVSLGHGNNEVGTIQPIADIGAICRNAGVLLHVDACQSFTKAPIDVRSDQMDLVTVNSHKLHGPTGVGALFVREGVQIEPLMWGGSQESGMRAGTLNTAGIVGFGEATRQAASAATVRMRAQLDGLRSRLLAALPGAWANGPLDLCHILSITLPGRNARRVFQSLNRRGILISTGSACASGRDTPSHVLSAMGLSPDDARSTLRISTSRYTTSADLDRLADELVTAVDKEDQDHGR